MRLYKMARHVKRRDVVASESLKNNPQGVCVRAGEDLFEGDLVKISNRTGEWLMMRVKVADDHGD